MANKITVFRGRSYPVRYTHKDSTGAVVPLTGKTLYFTVKSDESDNSANDSTAIIIKTVTSTEHTSPASGISDFTLTDADTFKDSGKYYFDVIIEDEDTGLAEPPSLYGQFIIKGTPTNRNVGNET